ncbi:MAG: type III-B CRISPR module RAMP protein Cmr4 [Planctomycetota bacterium]|nr:type III-B CRISPR module RAMP protein Cmr4 [Planctomycetota bacterium]
MSEKNLQRAAAQREAALLFIHALAPLHPGSGTALGAVDLPVQRERHTQWPIIAGSSLKGVLRDACRPAEEDSAGRDDWLACFGPETAEADKHAGAVSLTDARILAFPVRSLRGVFAWVTCPAVLARLARDAQLTRRRADNMRLPRPPAKNKAVCAPGTPLLVENRNLVLEEFDFEREAEGDIGPLAEWLASRAFAEADSFTPDRLRKHLVVLHDDDFTHFVRHATEIAARIGLDYERKTVKSGALFYEEFLPAETLFYSVVVADKSRREGNGKSAAEMLCFLKNRLPAVTQIGGDETIGRGLCALRLDLAKEGV